jgi:tetratricopeptide (TPR) repeat protein
MGIRIRQNIALLLIIMAAGLSNLTLFGQGGLQKASRQAATDAFSKEDYEKAYNEFSILLQVYPRDPLYKYYSGVCLVKLNRDPLKASLMLGEALNGSLDIKSIPDDAWFYLGRSQQMSGKYADAIKSYTVFENRAGKKSTRTYNVSSYINECNNGRGRLTMVTEPGATKEISRRQSLPAGYDRLLSEAMKCQVRADSLNALAAGYKREYNALPPSQKPAAKSRISELESLAAGYQKLADDNFIKAGVRSEAGKDTALLQPAAQKAAIVNQNTDPGQQAANVKITKPVQAREPVSNNTEEIYSMFKVEADPAAIKNQKIQIDPELPAGLVYRIQMGVFSKPLSPGFFRGISPASGFTVPGTGSTRYFVGMFRRMADANRSLLAVKQAGFRDSFITAILDGKPVSIDRAAIIEKEWSQKPLFKSVSNNTNVADEGPSTLMFRVELARTAKPVSREMEDTYRKLAGNRGFDIFSTQEDSTAYIIGKFITFESAFEYADLLVRNGYRDAKVVAYLGLKEVPVETAKELFEKIK